MAERDRDASAADLRVAVAVADFYADISAGLLSGAMEVLRRSGAEDPTVVRVAGAFELPIVVERLIAAGHDCVIALGAVILGETDHYEHIATQCAAGLQRVALDTGVPVAFGVLTVRDREHAVRRSDPGPGNKGAEAAEAAIRTVNLLRRLGPAHPGGPEDA
jgi:6,7-dimethyl-8-ribityllumazine synthase